MSVRPFLVLVFFAGVLVAGGSGFGTAAATGPCDAIPGVWSWFANGDVSFGADGSLVQGSRTGRWSCTNGQVTIVWSHGYTDSLTLAADGTSMQGLNQAGNTVWGRRSAAPQTFMVFVNCQVDPCVMGVAEPGYAVPGNQRYAEGWRRFNTNPYPLTDFPDAVQAWRFACRIHYTDARYSAPAIAEGQVDCAALCNGNPRCP